MSYRQLGEKGKAIADLESSLEQEIDPKTNRTLNNTYIPCKAHKLVNPSDPGEPYE